MKARIVKASKYLIALAIVAFAFYLLHRMLGKYNLDDILIHIKALTWQKITIALLLTMANYFVLTWYDYLGVRYTGHKLPYSKIAFAACSSYAVSHSLGFSSLIGTSLRYRIYSSNGLKVLEIAKIVIMCGLTFGLGYFTVLGLALIFDHRITASASGIKPIFFHIMGGAILTSVILYIILAKISKTAIHIRSYSFKLPGIKMTVLQIFLGSIDVIIAAAVLFVLMPERMNIGFIEFVGIYVIAILLSTTTHVPGGIGILEFIVLLFLSSVASPATLLGGLIAFRGVYYLLPLIIAAAALAIFELSMVKSLVVKSLVLKKPDGKNKR